MDIIKRLTGLKPHQLLFAGIAASILFTEIIVAPLSILFRGEITYDYLITGAIAALFVSFGVVYILASLIGTLKITAVSLEESEKKYRGLMETFKSEKDKLSIIFEAMADSVLITNDKRQIEYTNSAFEKEFGESKNGSCLAYFDFQEVT